MITLWISLGLAAFILAFALPLLAICFAVATGDDDDFSDVERFVELTEKARGLVPPGLPLLDTDKERATTDAIARFQARKEEARRALWASNRGRGVEQA